MFGQVKKLPILLLVFVLCLSTALADVPETEKAGESAAEAETWSLVLAPAEAVEELAETQCTVCLYRVAAMAADGLSVGEACDGFENLDLEALAEDGEAELLRTRTEEALLLAENAEVYRTGKISACAGTLEGLEEGVYLLTAEPVLLPGCQYVVQPVLVFVPGRNVRLGQQEQCRVFLKLERENRFGDVVIEKELLGYHKDLQQAVCVFSVDAVLDGETIYSDVRTLSFTEPGVKRCVVENLPAGAEVTVKEIYDGASYSLRSEATATVTVIAAGEEDVATVRFVNDYDGSYKGGTAVVNFFGRESMGWRWEQRADNAQ